LEVVWLNRPYLVLPPDSTFFLAASCLGVPAHLKYRCTIIFLFNILLVQDTQFVLNYNLVFKRGSAVHFFCSYWLSTVEEGNSGFGGKDRTKNNFCKLYTADGSVKIF